MEDFGIAQLTVANNAEDFAAGICALCQQACEKMLKAFLLAQGKSFAHIHDLRPLGEECAKTLPDLEPLLSELADLTVDFAPSRYPAEVEDGFGESDARRAVRTMEQLERLLRDRVPQYPK